MRASTNAGEVALEPAELCGDCLVIRATPRDLRDIDDLIDAIDVVPTRKR